MACPYNPGCTPAYDQTIPITGRLALGTAGEGNDQWVAVS